MQMQKLLNREPTAEMLDEVLTVAGEKYDDFNLRIIWRAMFDVALSSAAEGWPTISRDAIEHFRGDFMAETNYPRRRQLMTLCDQALRALDAEKENARLAGEVSDAGRQRDEHIADKHRILREYEEKCIRLAGEVADLQQTVNDAAMGMAKLADEVGRLQRLRREPGGSGVDENIYTKADAEALCEIAVTAVAHQQSTLAPAILAMCKQRGWSLHWTCRGAYLHLESSELIEAIRGKHGDPLKEAGDVLVVLMSITENAGIPWSAVTRKARDICAELMTKPHYPGEEFSALASSRERKGDGE